MGYLAQTYALRFTQAQLETMLDDALAEHAGGKALSSWSSLDTSAQRTVYTSLPPDSRAAELILALCIKAPDTYDASTLLPVRRSVVTFFDPQRNR